MCRRMQIKAFVGFNIFKVYVILKTCGLTKGSPHVYLLYLSEKISTQLIHSEYCFSNLLLPVKQSD